MLFSMNMRKALFLFLFPLSFSKGDLPVNDPKADAALNLSLSLPDSLKERSLSLSAVQTGDIWEILVLASEDLSFLSNLYPQIEVSMLYENFAVIRLPAALIPVISMLPSILYIEMPKYISFELLQGKRASCITQVQQPPLSLTGKGVLVGIVDSGIDLTHPDFQNPDGSSRVLFLWDQDEVSGPAPSGYLFGTEYDSDTINTALQSGRTLSMDDSGHGTAVAGIACGNGTASAGRYRGIAREASLIVVKMRRNNGLYPRTTELISGINYCIEKSLQLSMPLALNISFGNNYGAHTGTSLLETYLDRVSLLGRISIIIASGNEGASPIHTFGFLDTPQSVDFSISNLQTSLSLQLWKDYADLVRIRLKAPSGAVYTLSDAPGTSIFTLDGTQIAFYNSEPSPFQRLQEYYFEFFPTQTYLTPGIWSLMIEPLTIKNGTFHMWLPAASSLNTSTRFLFPDPYNTLTIPSTSSAVITAGAYDARTYAPADFSGRGPLDVPFLLTKPDLVAPGVSITAPASPKSYQSVSGTSFAAPFVTGSAALLMEWGITQGNNPFLYGERLKAWLIAGAKELPGFPPPNPRTGWGALCLAESFPQNLF